jgi:GMP synthase (glutamine-hydrolysing)
VIEPLAKLYKVEVRELGERLGIEKNAIWRHPFPGPGLGVRLLCNNGQVDPAPQALDVSQIKERFGLDAMVLPIRSVGVKADLRVYEHPVMLCGEASFETLLAAASFVCVEMPGINRCIWNLTPRNPECFRPLARTVTAGRLDVLRRADDMVMKGLSKHGVYDDVWQCPTVLVPLATDHTDGEMIVLRPIHSKRAMTASAAQLPQALLDELRESILSIDGVTGLAFDLTSKPPGTIEWE